MKSPYDQLSGFENDAFNDFAQEGFLESLDTEIATDIEICNYDLSECKPIRAVIQNNVQDTKLKTLVRHALVPIGTCKSGMYVKYKNRYWLIVGLVDDNKMYEKAVLAICNYFLTWVNERGQIIQRWTNVTSASQYNNGETSTSYYFIRSDQLLILLPNDDESLLLNTGKRFIIDQRCKIYEKGFNNVIDCDCSKPVNVYDITRTDTVLFDYQDGGHNEIMVFQQEQKPTEGYYVIDGKGYWLCERPAINKTGILSGQIVCEEPIVYLGLEPTTFEARFYDTNQNEINITPQWEIRCDFLDDLKVQYIDNYISIFTDNRKLKNKTFTIALSGQGYEETTIDVKIKLFI